MLLLLRRFKVIYLFDLIFGAPGLPLHTFEKVATRHWKTQSPGHATCDYDTPIH